VLLRNVPAVGNSRQLFIRFVTVDARFPTGDGGGNGTTS
jgi:hypothetical protein